MSQYYNKNNILRKDLLDREAKEEADKFVFKEGNKIKGITSAQLRRFYGEFKGLEKKLQFKKQSNDNAIAFLSILPLIKMTKSKAEYAKARKTIPDSFLKWLNRHVDAINTEQDFEAFLLHFEAVVGFCYGNDLQD